MMRFNNKPSTWVSCPVCGERFEVPFQRIYLGKTEVGIAVHPIDTTDYVVHTWGHY